MLGMSHQCGNHTRGPNMQREDGSPTAHPQLPAWTVPGLPDPHPHPPTPCSHTWPAWHQPTARQCPSQLPRCPSRVTAPRRAAAPSAPPQHRPGRRSQLPPRQQRRRRWRGGLCARCAPWHAQQHAWWTWRGGGRVDCEARAADDYGAAATHARRANAAGATQAISHGGSYCARGSGGNLGSASRLLVKARLHDWPDGQRGVWREELQGPLLH
eukprot:353931-Chlamydomonas_euryale.AAC.2